MNTDHIRLLFLTLLKRCQVTYVPEDDDEKEGASRQTTHGFAPGDVFMVFEYVDYDLSGLLKCRDVVCA